MSPGVLHSCASTPLHRWRPAEKWLGFLLLMLAFSTVQSVRDAVAVLLLAAGLFAWGRCGNLVQRLLQVGAPLALLIVPATALAVSPRSHSLWGIAYSDAGLRVGLVTVLRCLALLLLALALVQTTAPGGLFGPLRSFGVPRRIVEVLWLAERFVRGVGREGQSLRRAASCRGYALRARFRALRTLGVLAGAHLMRSLQRSERVHRVMSARGYSGSLRLPPLAGRTPGDIVLLGVFVVLAAAVTAARWWS